jgi:hypothetical protein
MSRVLEAKVGPLASASATNIATSQTAVGTVTLNGSLVSGGIAVLDKPRHAIVTSGGDDTLLTFTATGTDFSGYPMVASVVGTNTSTADFGVSFATISAIAVTVTSSGAAGTSHSGLTVGTNIIADSVPINLDEFGFPAVALQVIASGTVNYTVNQTLDDFTNTNWLGGAGGISTSFSKATWINSADSAVVAATGSQQSNYAFAPKWMRVTLNSGTGSVVLSAIQAASPSK